MRVGYLGLGLALLSPNAMTAQRPAKDTFPPTTILAVPYLPQSSVLCGGAALAMVERWWGKVGVYAEDFAALVKPGADGIVTTDLVNAAAAKGWEVAVVHGVSAVKASLDDSVPPIAIIQVAPNRYHYVVIVSWGDGEVVFHDPAGAPYTRLKEAKFISKWTGGNQWALLVTPSPAPQSNIIPVALTPIVFDSLPCRPWLDRSIDSATANRLPAATAMLDSARTNCPEEKLVLRELAGIRFKEKNYPEAVRLVTEYLVSSPSDAHAWQLLATSHFLADNPDEALDAWNKIGAPTLDIVSVSGDLKFKFQTILDAAGLQRGEMITANELALAGRRVADIPALRNSDVRYRPLTDGKAEVIVDINERPEFEKPLFLFGGNAVRGIVGHELQFDVVSPAKVGELWALRWRWEKARPIASFRLDIPTTIGIVGVASISGSRESSRISLESGSLAPTILNESVRTVGLGFTAWLSPALHPSASVRLEQWSQDRDYLVATGGIKVLLKDERVQFAASATHAASISNALSYDKGNVNISWLSALGISGGSVSARLGADWVTSSAPVTRWPLAGGNSSWAVPLRAHALVKDDAVIGDRIGQGVLQAGIGADHSLHRIGPVMVGTGMFVDAARILRPLSSVGNHVDYLDVGAGLRFGLPGAKRYLMHMDIARSLIGERTWRFTAGVQR